jgi:hypothetical protein
MVKTETVKPIRIKYKNKKYVLKLYKTIMKTIRQDIKEINKDIKECIKTLSGYENFILDSILYVKDRDNLISSKIENIFKIKISCLKSYLSSIPEWALKISVKEETTCKDDIDMRDIVKGEDLIVKSDKIFTNLLEINKNSLKDINALIEFIPDYIQNINLKLKAFLACQSSLKVLYDKIKYDYSLIKVANINNLL